MNLDQDYKNILKDFTKSNPQVYFHDDLPTLENYNQRLIDLHPNAEGYRLFAESIFKYLKDHDFISCK
jgi:lysophospholipase L1-like esterase